MKVLRVYMFDTPSNDPATMGLGLPSIQVEGLHAWSNQDLACMSVTLGGVLYAHRGDDFAAAQERALVAMVGASPQEVQEQIRGQLGRVLNPEPVSFVYDPSAEGGEE